MIGMTMKKRVENAVKELGLGGPGQRLSEKEIVAKLMGQLNANPTGYDSDITTFEEDDATGPSDDKAPPLGGLLKPYQATVEDDVSSQDGYSAKGDSGGNDESLGVISQPNSPISEASVFSLSSNSSSLNPTIEKVRERKSSQAPASPTTPCRTPPRVHFTTRPIVLQQRSSEAIPPVTSLRPTLPVRSNTYCGMLPVDNEHDRLFTSDGEPTKRLELGLRAFARTIISECGPSGSLVLTPDMLQKFYTRYSFNPESLPFNRIFESHSKGGALRNLEFLYIDLSCEYHLVPHNPKERPAIPALTPVGFGQWLTLLIRAFPDREAARLDMAMANSSTDAEGISKEEEKQKLPREMPRYLFPARGHDEACALLRDSVATWEGSSTTPYSSPSQSSPPFAHIASKQIPHAEATEQDSSLHLLQPQSKCPVNAIESLITLVPRAPTTATKTLA